MEEKIKEPENKPTGETVEGQLFAEEWRDPETGERHEVTEIHGPPVFIPRAWRGQLGLEDDDLSTGYPQYPEDAGAPLVRALSGEAVPVIPWEAMSARDKLRHC